ncbi:MAG TPA: CPBP family intramembrane metalloprotease domain-containing protein [Porphyromonadaceae bacterium]|nr:CPBP family intramembrane metalloprotease domain-containing protein [Porphyromonadaceae bacterium]
MRVCHKVISPSFYSEGIRYRADIFQYETVSSLTLSGIIMKGLFANRSAWFQLGILTYLFLFGLTFASVISIGISAIFNIIPDKTITESGTTPFYETHITQFISALCMFLLPALFTACLCSKKPGEFLQIRKVSDVRLFVLTGLMILLISPTIDITSYLNSKIHLPEFMSPLEKWMQETEDTLTGITEDLLSKRGVIPFITNITVIAVMAGFSEEFLFRGAFLTIVRKKISNPHIAIWTVAIIFSAIHFQFNGFIPRTILGAVLGYFLYWSKNIWIPVFAHFFHNAVAVTGSYIGIFKDSPGEIAPEVPDIKTEEIITTTIVAIFGLFLFALCANIMRKSGTGQKN